MREFLVEHIWISNQKWERSAEFRLRAETSVGTFCTINQHQMNPKPPTMTPPTTFVTRDSTGAPSKLRQSCISSMIQDDSKRSDDFVLFTCSYMLAWVGICMYFGGLNSEKWLWSLKCRNKILHGNERFRQSSGLLTAAIASGGSLGTLSVVPGNDTATWNL